MRMPMIRGLALLFVALVALPADAATRRAELCQNGNYHQAGHCPARLSAPTVPAGNIGSTSATQQVTTTRTGGTLYSFTDAAPCVQPSAATLKAGTGAAHASSKTAASLGESISASGLASDTSYCTYWVDTSAEGWDSNIVGTEPWTTLPTGSSNAPYDLSAYSIPWTVQWPQAPSGTLAACSAGTAAAFNACADDNGQRITVTGSFSGDINITGSDIEIVMPNAYTITGNLTITDASRIRWTGGNVVGNYFIRRATDVLFDDWYSATLRTSEVQAGTSTRIAWINSTLEQRSTNTGGEWSLHTNSSFSYSHFTLANVKFVQTGGGAGLMRLLDVDNVVIVDSAFYYTGTRYNSFRMHDGCDNVFVAGNLIQGAVQLHMETTYGVADVTNMTWTDNERYHANRQVILSTVGGSTNTGTVSNTTIHTSGGDSGAGPSYSPFTNGGGNSAVAWDGTTFPDVTGYGAIR